MRKCEPANLKFRMSVDIGGTFTDFVLQDLDRGRTYTEKVLSVPTAPAEAIFSGIDLLIARSGLSLSSCDFFLHATTIITNAVIERKGHDFIFVHTDGFGSTLETGREHRYNLSNLKLAFPAPLTRNWLKLPVQERTSAKGAVVLCPDRGEFISAAEELVGRTGITNFAVGFLHSFRNASNEKLVAEWLAEVFPRAHISTSSEVAPSQREYERWMTCAINAYTQPLLAEYIGLLDEGLTRRGFQGRAMLMTSAGVPMSFAHCVRYPVRMIESGPAAGVLAAKQIALRNVGEFGDSATLSNVLAYDMGGTTAKGAFLTDGNVRVQSGLEVARVGAFEAGSGFPLLIPAIDMIEIGAGGGSIAAIDDRGAIAVGPQSAGAEPGPACYNRGGTFPTVTDANLVLGLLDEANFRSSGIEVDVTLARRTIDDTIAKPLGITVERAALGIHDTINETVARAFRVHAADLGLDYRRYALTCTGGSAPLQAAAIARILNIRRVVFPFAAGVASAFGLFSSREGIVLQRTKLMRLHEASEQDIRTQVNDVMKSDAYGNFLIDAGASARVRLGLQYEGQHSEVMVSLGSEPDAFTPLGIRKVFERAYHDVFGLNFPGYNIEINSWIVEVISREGAFLSNDSKYANIDPTRKIYKSSRRCLMAERDVGTQAPIDVLDRYALPKGFTVEGPVLIEENDTTIYIPAQAHVRVASSFDLIMELVP